MYIGKSIKAFESGMCDACLRRGENLAKYGDDHLCDSCAALFWAAQVLFLNEITNEKDHTDACLRGPCPGNASSCADKGQVPKSRCGK
jgi:hypothetical protein